MKTCQGTVAWLQLGSELTLVRRHWTLASPGLPRLCLACLCLGHSLGLAAKKQAGPDYGARGSKYVLLLLGLFLVCRKIRSICC